MFSKVRTKNGKPFTDYTFKLGDTLFQIRKISDSIIELKINAKEVAKNEFGKYLSRVNQLITMQETETQVQLPNPQPNPNPQANPKPLELEPMEKNGKIPFDATKKGFYLSGDISVYYADGYTIVKTKEKITKVYFKGDKIPKEKWNLHQAAIDNSIQEATKN